MDKLNIQKDKQLLLDALNKAKKQGASGFVDDLLPGRNPVGPKIKIAKLFRGKLTMNCRKKVPAPQLF